MARQVLTVLGACALTTGIVLNATVVLFRTTLLDDRIYTRALDSTGVYDRIYTEVFTDPELIELKQELIGRIVANDADAAQVSALSMGALRWTLPPSRLRSATETFIDRLLAYVRGESARLDSGFDITDVVDRVDDTAAAQARTLLAEASESVASTLTEYEKDIQVFARSLGDGALPRTIPVYGLDLSPQEAFDTVMAVLGDSVDQQTKDRLRAAVLTGEDREVTIVAASVLIAEYARQIGEGLRSGGLDERQIDLIEALTDRTGKAPDEILHRVNTVRGVAGWFGPTTAGVSLLLMVLGVALLLAAHRRRPLHLFGYLAASPAAAGILFGVAWLVLAQMDVSPLAPATTVDPQGWNLPGSIQRVLQDVESRLGEDLNHAVLGIWTVLMGAAGSLALPTALVANRARLTYRRMIIITVLGGVAAVTAWMGTTPTIRQTEHPCNGHVELCVRPYDHVVQAATHNSMSSPDVVQVWPEQDLTVTEQLNSGVRVLLLDTHYWTPLISASQLADLEPYITQEAANRLMRAFAPLKEGRKGTYLCHIHCGLGATSFLGTLREIRLFLDENPYEVVTLLLQDKITSEDTEAAFGRSGLEPYLHFHEVDTPWPSLGQLIERNERLVVFSEFHTPPPDWNHHAFDHMQETPYEFRSPEDFSCAPNRGSPRADLFLMNHWVQRVAPDRSDAAEVNRRDVIVDRARRCEAERGQLPDFIAVNFSAIGDLQGAVDVLNGVVPSPARWGSGPAAAR
ncbi:MAG: hypothetical protein QG608_1313 [Actinomycetota bacterium]|nr:hypothetical protein [Actinomycetota bacterium]